MAHLQLLIPGLLFMYFCGSLCECGAYHISSQSAGAAQTQKAVRARLLLQHFSCITTLEWWASGKQKRNIAAHRQTDGQAEIAGGPFFIYTMSKVENPWGEFYSFFPLSRAGRFSEREKKSARHNKTPCVSSSGNNPRGLCQTTSYITAAQLSSSYASSS